MKEHSLSRLNKHFDTNSAKQKGLFSTFSGSFLGMMVSKPRKNKDSSASDLSCFETGLKGGRVGFFEEARNQQPT